MNGRYQAAISYVGAHLVPHRDLHEIDRAVQRAVIGSIMSALMVWHAITSSLVGTVVLALPVLAIAYAVAAVVHLKIVRAQPNRAVMAQYVFIVLDPVLTVIALAGMPLVLGPLNPLLLCQIVRCGIRFGMRTLWLTWSSAAIASVIFLPLSGLWLLREPLTQSCDQVRVKWQHILAAVFRASGLDCHHRRVGCQVERCRRETRQF